MLTRWFPHIRWPWQPKLSGTQRVEYVAAQIPDPVQRLKYLRQANARLDQQQSPVPTGRPISWKKFATFAAVILALFVPWKVISDARQNMRVYKPQSNRDSKSASTTSSVWIVDENSSIETYSNGLRVEKKFTTENKRRKYFKFSQPAFQISEDSFDQPAGIIFHTTESHTASLAPENTRVIKRLGEELLKFVRAERSYHYVIDRFGRVYRVVEELDSADHAGISIWGDSQSLLLSLNDAYLGVALEGQTQPSDTDAITPAQIVAAKQLTEMLRSKYQIEARDCVTHAQVSVNPINFEIGFHSDGGRDFPFSQLGLPDNYAVALPAIAFLGFEYKQDYLNKTSEALWVGLREGDKALRAAAKRNNLSVEAYTDKLRKQYRAMRAEIRARNQSEQEERAR
jgi:hypothetical protein